MFRRPFGNRASKYNARRCEFDGRKFASKREMKYYRALLARKAAGEIDRFDCQHPFVLLPAMYEGDCPCQSEGLTWRLEISRTGNRGKCLARALRYVADFVIWYDDGRCEVVDVKGYKTDIYKLKRRLMRQIHGIEIVEV